MDPQPAPPYPYTGPEELAAPVLTALRRVVDPEVSLSIVDVGLIYAVTATPEQLQVRMTMTSAACPVTDVIIDEVYTELERVVPESMMLDVELVWEPPWTTDLMSARAKAFMGW